MFEPGPGQWGPEPGLAGAASQGGRSMPSGTHLGRALLPAQHDYYRFQRVPDHPTLLGRGALAGDEGAGPGQPGPDRCLQGGDAPPNNRPRPASQRATGAGIGVISPIRCNKRGLWPFASFARCLQAGSDACPSAALFSTSWILAAGELPPVSSAPGPAGRCGLLAPSPLLVRLAVPWAMAASMSALGIASWVPDRVGHPAAPISPSSTSDAAPRRWPPGLSGGNPP